MNYASDITVTFPIDKKFNSKQKSIYDIVLNANTLTKNMIREGVNFKDLYLTSLNIIYQWIKNLGLINLEKQKQYNLTNEQVAKLLMLHGLGHFIGLDVHDVGGSLYCYSKNKMFGKILFRDMVITIEPSIYFIKQLINKFDKLFNDNIIEYMNIGGVRIEDVILITNDGYEQLSNVIR